MVDHRLVCVLAPCGECELLREVFSFRVSGEFPCLFLSRFGALLGRRTRDRPSDGHTCLFDSLLAEEFCEPLHPLETPLSKRSKQPVLLSKPAMRSSAHPFGAKYSAARRDAHFRAGSQTERRLDKRGEEILLKSKTRRAWVGPLRRAPSRRSLRCRASQSRDRRASRGSSLGGSTAGAILERVRSRCDSSSRPLAVSLLLGVLPERLIECADLDPVAPR